MDGEIINELRIWYEYTNKMGVLKRKDLVFPDESYKIVGVLFEVYNTIGPGHNEKYYQRAIANEFKRIGIPFREQVYSPLRFKDKVIGKNYFDFLLWEKIILEIKRGDKFSKRHIDQVLEYLKTKQYQLALLANFARDGVKFKRIINF